MNNAHYKKANKMLDNKMKPEHSKAIT